MHHPFEQRRTHPGVLALVAGAVLLATVLIGPTAAWAAGDPCASATGYRACPATDGGAAVGSAIVPGASGVSDDLPITGTSPVRTLVIGSALIVFGAAAVAGSLQARRPSRSS
jgi:hypothetical protein